VLHTSRSDREELNFTRLFANYTALVCFSIKLINSDKRETMNLLMYCISVITVTYGHDMKILLHKQILENGDLLFAQLCEYP